MLYGQNRQKKGRLRHNECIALCDERPHRAEPLYPCSVSIMLKNYACRYTLVHNHRCICCPSMLHLFARQICFSTSLNPNTGAHRSCWSSSQPPRHFLARINFCGMSRPASTACAVLSSFYISVWFSLCLAGVGKVRALGHLKGHCLPLRRSLCCAVVAAPAQPAPAAIMAPTDTGTACAAAVFKHNIGYFPTSKVPDRKQRVPSQSGSQVSACQLSCMLCRLLP